MAEGSQNARQLRLVRLTGTWPQGSLSSHSAAYEANRTDPRDGSSAPAIHVGLDGCEPRVRVGLRGDRAVRLEAARESVPSLTEVW